MELLDLLETANAAYPDNSLATYFDRRTGALVEGHGDGLAAFIVAELLDTFDGSAPTTHQYQHAIRALQRAVADIELVRAALRAACAAHVRGTAVAEPLLTLAYTCPECDAEWYGEWTCAVNDECPNCGIREIEPTDYWPVGESPQ